MIRRRTPLPVAGLSGALLALGFAAAVGADDLGARVPANMTTATDAGETGAEIYSQVCQGCHMPQAEGAEGAGHYPRLAGDQALVSWEYVALTVLNGRKGMPAFATQEGVPAPMFSARLSDAQIAAVVNYLRSNFGNHYRSKVTAAQVAALPHNRSAEDL